MSSMELFLWLLIIPRLILQVLHHLQEVLPHQVLVVPTRYNMVTKIAVSVWEAGNVEPATEQGYKTT